MLLPSRQLPLTPNPGEESDPPRRMNEIGRDQLLPHVPRYVGATLEFATR